MGFVELLLLAIGLSMDAFAVSVCKGLCMKRLNLRQATVVALFFGGFQALMPLVGWALGTQFEQFITPVDHWIAFVLLALIGGKMLWDAFHEDDEELSCPADGKLDLRELVMLAVATSIDALAVSRPVSSDTMVWKFSSASSRPCEISGWYGVYAVYQAGFSMMLRNNTGGVNVSK